MLTQRLLCLPAIALASLAALAASLSSCSSASNGSGDAGDDRSAIDLDSTLLPSEASTCDPCSQVCPCSPGDMFYNPATCANEVCGSSGEWGGVSCTVGPGCPESTATCPKTVPCGALLCPDNDYCLATLDGGVAGYACVEVCSCATAMSANGCVFGCFGPSVGVGFTVPAGCTCSPPDASRQEPVTVTCGAATPIDAGADAAGDAGGDADAQPVADAADQ